MPRRWIKSFKNSSFAIAILAFGNCAATNAVVASSSNASDGEKVYHVDPVTATLQVRRVDFSLRGVEVLVRSFNRNEKERVLFGPGWCSNLDIQLVGADGSQPKVIELRECGAKRTRTFHKVLEAWVEDSSTSRILRKADGRWELNEFPHPTFRHDGKLDSFLTSDQKRWFVRRDSTGRPEALDNLKGRPIRIRRNLSGDVDAIVDNAGKVVVRYDLATALDGTEVKGVRESFEYDADGNLLRLIRKSPRADAVLETWRFSYTSSEWVSSAQGPDGCTSRWIFDRSVENGGESLAVESKECAKKFLNDALKPLAATPTAHRRSVAAVPAKIVPNGGEKSADMRGIEIVKAGPMGLGKIRASVMTNTAGLPVAFVVNNRRLEIVREKGSGSALLIRQGNVEVNFRKKPRQYESRQLELLDEYEEWMSAWGARGS